MAEFEPLFRAVIHGVQADCPLEAFQIYFLRVKQTFPMNFVAHELDQIAIKVFFDRSWESPLSELPSDAVYFLLSCAATNLMAAGDLEESIPLSTKCIEYFVGQEKWLEATFTAGPLVSMLLVSGDLDGARQLMSKLKPYVERTNHPVILAIAKNFEAYSSFLGGDLTIAEKLFLEVEEVFCKPIIDVDVTFPTVSSYYCKFLLDTARPLASLNRSLKTFAWRNRKSWQVSVDTTSILASDILVLGLTFLAMGDKVNAKLQLDKQVDLFKRADEWLYLPTGLNGRAKYYLAVENFEAAIQDLEEALEISKRTGARFGEWETYLELAKVHVTMGDLERGREFLSKAQALPNMKNFKFRDQEIEWLEQELV
jgi:tetratricopeptide (TPR) repeat protein